MKVLVRVAAAAALMVPLFVASPASAQHYRVDFGLNGGYSWYSALLGDDELGGEDADVRFNANWLLGSQLTFWFTPRIGLRANMTYTDTDLQSDDVTFHEHVNLWSGTGDLMFRFREPNEEWLGSEFLPYVALGLGAKWINPAGDWATCGGGEDDDSSCHPFYPTGAGGFALEEATSFAGLVGLGADWRVSPNFAVRLEVNDRIYKPEVYEITGAGPAFTRSDENVASTVHEIAGQIGLHILAGLQEPPVVAVAPAPPPPPPPAPEPPPAPREESISVCVVDPTAPNGLRMQEAVYLVDEGDTVVVVNGNRQPLSTSVGTVVTASNQPWYVSGAPLVVDVGATNYEYLTYQGAVRIESDRLTYLGTVNGLPVYADRDQVADVASQLADVRQARASGDLEDILDEEDDLREAVDALQVVYVPLQPTGCVFQPLQRQQQVRKGK
ncbi:MAG TPA: outer membrane beta-barrel protein [Longimicrobiales bacterium]|nr:outer membrane beta-barrel protein [Longimicrobiales bacterium]